MRAKKTLTQILACQLPLTLVQLLFLFHQEKTLMQTLADELLSCMHQLPCKSCSRLARQESLQNLHTNSRLFNLINSHATLVLL